MDTCLALVSTALFGLFGYISIVACLVACSGIQPARMSLPEAFSARAISYQVQGINVGTRGEFYLNDPPGSYYRSASRLEVFDVYDGRSSTLSFNFDGTLTDCSAKEQQLNFRDLNFSPKPMAYACDFEQTDGARWQTRVARSPESTCWRLRATLEAGRVSLRSAPVENPFGTRSTGKSPRGKLTHWLHLRSGRETGRRGGNQRRCHTVSG